MSIAKDITDVPGSVRELRPKTQKMGAGGSSSGVGPETHQLETVDNILRSAYFSLFSVPDPLTPDVPVKAKLPFPFSLLTKLPGFPQLLTAVEVNETPLRFQTKSVGFSDRVFTVNRVGEEIATVHIRWTPIPWEYRAQPTRLPPTTILNPLLPQRFEMLDGMFKFNDSVGSGMKGFGSGRTFPNFPRRLSLGIGAVVDVVESFGGLAGYSGLMVVNGTIQPPEQLNLSIMQRILYPGNELLTESDLPEIVDQPFPDSDSRFMIVLGEPDRVATSDVEFGGAGELRKLRLRERLREIQLDAHVGASNGLRSRMKVGKIIGRTTLELTVPVGACGVVPIAMRSRLTEFQFFSSQQPGKRIGSVSAELVEGRGFPTVLPEAPGEIYRVGAFGPIRGGTGDFADAEGILSLNGAISLYPRTFSNLYVFRLKA